MRILLATDGSACASTAVDFVAGLPWPTDTTIEAAVVINPNSLSAWPFAPVPDLQGYHEELASDALKTVNEVVSRLHGRGLRATAKVLHGPEAESIVQRAIETETGLIVCGSRGRGHLRSVLMGSVSAQIAATAPCSVLVARHPVITGVVLAADGTGPALAAEHLVARLPMFEGRPVHLVTVTGQPTGPEGEWQAEVRRISEVQREVGARLRRQGRDPREVLLTGTPAREIIDEAQRSRADLIVLGAHGQTGLDRLLLGSTTLDVMTHSHASVLVAREAVYRARSMQGGWTAPMTAVLTAAGGQ